ncbi:MAG: hypothetical protein JWQ90_5154 [Hydrocarboniphaga sp.]|uniref:HvfC family RiPP maturation protein n=1 Tax=Hydrocarboniphaga sp. TaxID=2033016 RepID=UPI00260A360B|nr:putative DNA-binding domain-containing protein [Hydrocarboniphaga sp.]MDB5972704.1 hypothetical protein [Hydrocarboniphaga sp.]
MSSAAATALAKTQYALTAALRDPQLDAPDGVSPAALQVYRRLVYNNIERTLAGTFPVLRSICGDDDWHARLRRFVAEHRCQNPELRHLPEDFIAWLDASSLSGLARSTAASARCAQAAGALVKYDSIFSSVAHSLDTAGQTLATISQARQAASAGERGGDPGWIAELCHYEWVELALASDPTELKAELPFSFERPPQLSPLAWTLSYRYPVHRIGMEHQPQSAPADATYLCVYRNRGDEVRFMEINALTLLLLRAIESQPQLSARDLLQTLAVELDNADPDAIVEAGSTLLNGLVQRDIILGSRSA